MESLSINAHTDSARHARESGNSAFAFSLVGGENYILDSPVGPVMKTERLVYIVTHPITALNLMCGQLAFLHNKGMEVYLISSPAEELKRVEEQEGIPTLPVMIEREIHPLKDLITLFRLYRIIKKLKPGIVNASTPKAGFLGTLAAWMARVPVRIYTLRGLRLETKKGLTRFVLNLTESIASACAVRVICVSESLRQRYISLGFADEPRTAVLGSGSSNGVDAQRFLLKEDSQKGETLRAALSIPPNAPVIGYVGRLTRDKGIAELLDGFELLLKLFPNLHLLVLGDFESGDPIGADHARKLREHPQIVLKGFISDVENYYQIMDVLVFPSYREGFPNAPLEAAASCVPTVGFRVTGTVDAVEDGRTGRLVPFGDVLQLTKAISSYLQEEELRKGHGRAARERVLRDFQQEYVWKALHQEYLDLLQQNERIHSKDFDHSHHPEPV